MQRVNNGTAFESIERESLYTSHISETATLSSHYIFFHTLPAVKINKNRAIPLAISLVLPRIENMIRNV